MLNNNFPVESFEIADLLNEKEARIFLTEKLGLMPFEEILLGQNTIYLIPDIVKPKFLERGYRLPPTLTKINIISSKEILPHISLDIVGDANIEVITKGIVQQIYLLKEGAAFWTKVPYEGRRKFYVKLQNLFPDHVVFGKK